MTLTDTKIEWTPSSDGTFSNIQIKATDASEGETTQTFNLIIAPNFIPVISQIEDKSYILNSDDVDITILITDNDDVNLSTTIISINESGVEQPWSSWLTKGISTNGKTIN